MIFFSPLCFSHNNHSSEKQIEAVLNAMAKVIRLDPELLPAQYNNVPFYELNGHKIYLDTAFWNLTRAFLELYIQELEAYCPCDLDPEVMIAESKSYLYKSPALSKTIHLSKSLLNLTLVLGAGLTAKYGYTVAAVKVSSEIAETILSFFVGLKGLHLLCSAIDFLIFPLARKTQKALRVFSYGSHLGYNSFVFSIRMAWYSRQIKKSKKRVFFALKRALEFNEKELNQLNSKGPKSFFYPKGHRRTWLERLKSNTDPVFKEIGLLEEEISVLVKEVLALEEEKSVLETEILVLEEETGLLENKLQEHNLSGKEKREIKKQIRDKKNQNKKIKRQNWKQQRQ